MPSLVASNVVVGAIIPEDRASGQWHVGDQFYLMTDALAAWFLSTYERGEKPWLEIAQWYDHANPEAGFAAWIAALRSEHRLRNDDVTLIVIKVSDDYTFTQA